MAVSRMMTCPHDGKEQGSRVSKASRERRHSQSRGIVASTEFQTQWGERVKGQSSANRFQKAGESIHTEYWVRNGDRAMSAMGDELYGKIH